DEPQLLSRLNKWRAMSPRQACELVHLLHFSNKPSTLAQLAKRSALYEEAGPDFSSGTRFGSQAEVAFLAMASNKGQGLPITTAVLRQIFKVLAKTRSISEVLPSFFFDR